MKTILIKDLESEDVTNVVLFENDNDGVSVHLYTMADQKGRDSKINAMKRGALQEVAVEMLRREKAFDTQENRDIQSAVIAGVGYRGRSAEETKKLHKDAVVGKMAVQDLRASKEAEINNATAVAEVDAITW